MTKPTCFICGLKTEGRGHYTFKYLDEVVTLCGHHAQKVMKYIKRRQEGVKKSSGVEK